MPRTRWWTQEEIDYLRDNHRRISMEDIAHHLKWPVEAVYRKASSLSLDKRYFLKDLKGS